MNTSIIDRLTRTLLFEGYALYPYRADAGQPQRRRGPGTLYPRAWCEAEGSDPWAMQTEVLVRGALSIADVRIRFLHLRDRVGETAANEASRRHEAKEHEIALPLCSVAELVDAPRTHRIDIAGAVERDSQRDVHKMITRRAEPLLGVVELSAELVGGAIARLRVRVRNETPVAPELWGASELRERRRLATRTSFVSTHTLIGIADGALVSLRTPPAELATAAAACRNAGTWPVLVGEVGSTDTMLSSPIILADYPAGAPERIEPYGATKID